jgi:O-antigen ligase
MFKLLTVLSLLFALFTLATLPWVAPVLYTTFSILQPQYVWFWVFDGSIPYFKILAGLIFISWIIQASQKNIDYSVYKLPINKALFALTFFVNLSHWVATYAGGLGAELVLEIFNTTMLLYFTCSALITDEQGTKYLTYGFILTAVYYGYDANMAYFDGDWSRFVQGRLGGPPQGAYSDNNKFAVILVIGFPFLILGFFYFKKVVVKLFMILGMVWVLHGIFLTGSRGALLAVAAAVFVTTRGIDLSSFKKKLVNLAIVTSFIFVVLDQAGGTLSRAQEVSSNRAQEQATNPRILSWQVGLKLIGNHPVFGVGVHNFRIASATEFPGESPHVAHNTFITFAANSGLIAGLLYLYTFWACYIMLRKINKITPKESINRYAANSAFAALGGFFVSAIFLDMIVFEPYYYLMMLMTVCYVQSIKTFVHASPKDRENIKNV